MRINQDDFLAITETLRRIGVLNIEKNTITQSCHILHKQGKYYIAHFKELLALDGNLKKHIEIEDIKRRNKIVNLLKEWNLVEVFDVIGPTDVSVFVCKHSDKHKYVLKSNYTFNK